MQNAFRGVGNLATPDARTLGVIFHFVTRIPGPVTSRKKDPKDFVRPSRVEGGTQ